jgi:hypothetical protein
MGNLGFSFRPVMRHDRSARQTGKKLTLIFDEMSAAREVHVGVPQSRAEAAYLASHPSANATAVMPHEVRNAVTISLNHSQQDTNPSSSRPHAALHSWFHV